MAGEGIVARVVSGHGHDGACAVAGQHIFRNPDRNIFACEGVYGIRACEHTRYGVVGHAVELGALLYVSQIFVYGSLLFGGGELLYQLALRSQHHEGNAEDGVGACGEDGEMFFAVFYCELHLGAFRTAYPVALCFFYRVAPVDGVETVEQTL